jgi:hypothetical protein
VRTGHCSLSPFCSGEPLDEVQRGLGDLDPPAVADQLVAPGGHTGIVLLPTAT